VVDDGGDDIIIVEDLNEEEAIIINNDVMHEVDGVGPDPRPPVNCQVIHHVEEEEGDDAV
jgi:hypothetical protein